MKPDPRDFCAIWFESLGHWLVVNAAGRAGWYGGSVGESVGAYMDEHGIGEADVDWVEDGDGFYRYVPANDDGDETEEIGDGTGLNEE